VPPGFFSGAHRMVKEPDPNIFAKGHATIQQAYLELSQEGFSAWMRFQVASDSELSRGRPEVAEILGLSEGRASVILKELHDKGYIEIYREAIGVPTVVKILKRALISGPNRLVKLTRHLIPDSNIGVLAADDLLREDDIDFARAEDIPPDVRMNLTGGKLVPSVKNDSPPAGNDGMGGKSTSKSAALHGIDDGNIRFFDQNTGHSLKIPLGKLNLGLMSYHDPLGNPIYCGSSAVRCFIEALKKDSTNQKPYEEQADSTESACARSAQDRTRTASSSEKTPMAKNTKKDKNHVRVPSDCSNSTHRFAEVASSLEPRSLDPIPRSLTPRSLTPRSLTPRSLSDKGGQAITRRKVSGSAKAPTPPTPKKTGVDMSAMRAGAEKQAGKRKAASAQRVAEAAAAKQPIDWTKLDQRGRPQVTFEPSDAQRVEMLETLRLSPQNPKRRELVSKLGDEYARIYSRYRRMDQRETGRVVNYEFNAKEKKHAIAAAILCLQYSVTPRQVLEYWHVQIKHFADAKLRVPPITFLTSPTNVDRVACQAMEVTSEKGRQWRAGDFKAGAEGASNRHSYGDVTKLDPRLRPGLESAGFDISGVSDRYLMSVQSAAMSRGAGAVVFVGKHDVWVQWAAENMYHED